MRRFYVEVNKINNNQVIIDGQEFLHLRNVLRMAVGDEAIVVCGDEWDYYVKIVSVGKHEAVAEIVNRELNSCNPKANVAVYQALCKKDTLASLTTHLNELGVSKFVLFESKHTVAKDKNTKAEKLQSIANQSVKQCRRSIPMQVSGTLDFKQLLQNISKHKLVVLAYENQKDVRLNDVLSFDNALQDVAIIVGPEGGFAQNEVQALVEAGAKCVSLGSRILKVETATIALSALVLSAVGEV